MTFGPINTGDAFQHLDSKMATQEESEDLLDYHITFPSPVSQDLYDDDGFETSPETSDQKEPVVILLGWAGCQDKHLAKYSAIYDQRR